MKAIANYTKCKASFTKMTVVLLMDNRLKELRERDDLTQEDLAARVGVSRQTIISLERGKYNPSLILAYNLVRVFGLRIEDVFLLEGRKGDE